MTLDIHGLMQELSNSRPIFHSEADFQHALAWHIHNMMPNSQVRLEYPNRHDDSTRYLDVWLPQEKIAIELKYPTRELELNRDSEHFRLVSHYDQRYRRYGFIKDIQRLEQVVKERDASGGFAVLLTNDAYYWKSPIKSWRTKSDGDFRLHEGRKVTGRLAWSESARERTEGNRRESIGIAGSYVLRWRKYSNFVGEENGRFQYLAVAVQ